MKDLFYWFVIAVLLAIGLPTSYKAGQGQSWNPEDADLRLCTLLFNGTDVNQQIGIQCKDISWKSSK